MTHFFSRHWRLVVLLVGMAIFLWILYLLRTVILPFALGLVLAYLLAPIINWLELKFPKPGKWPGFKRILSIFIVFFILLVLLAVFSYVIATAVIDASVNLATGAPYFISKSLYQITNWLEVLKEQFPPEVRSEVDRALLEAGIALGNAIRDALIKGVSFVPETFNLVLGLAALPLFLFYALKDSDKLKIHVYSAFTPGVSEHVRNLVSLIERVIGRYIRAQLMLGMIVAYLTFIGLLILEIPFAPVLAILAGIGELIPTLGPWISGAVVAIIALALAPDKVIWVIVLFLAVQLLENSLLVPRIQGGYLRIHPAAMIFMLVLGTYIAGFWGLLLAGPLTATGVEIYRYVRRHYQGEEIPKPTEEG
ncbi:MAG TPA: AI-2E family transporter [Dehalococcoidia bacterium]|nr:AI-2E family transporter [Dehalococcoidia bacterium]